MENKEAKYIGPVFRHVVLIPGWRLRKIMITEVKFVSP